MKATKAILTILLSLGRSKKTIRLDSAVERQLWLTSEPPISSVTLFECDGGYDEIIVTLERRAQRIEGFNPWLRGRIRPTGLFGASVLEYDETSDGDQQIVKKEQNMIPPNFSPENLYTCMSSLIEVDVNAGPLWRVSVLKQDDNCVAVVVTISHLIADGCTYYRIIEMLFSESQYELNMSSISDELKISILGKEQFDYQHSPMFFLKGILGIIERAITKVEVDEAWFLIDKERLRLEKERFSTERGFVSTNDILASRFFRDTLCNVGSILINLRSFLGRKEPDILGRNHWGVMFHRSEDCYEPSFIRESMKSIGRSSSSNLPSFSDFLFGDLATVSSVRGLSNLSLWSIRSDAKVKYHFLVDNFAASLPSRFVLMRISDLNQSDIVARVVGEKRLVKRIEASGSLLKRMGGIQI